MTEALKNDSLPHTDVDPHALQIDRLHIGDVEVTLVGVDHVLTRMPQINPWPTIERKIEGSSLTYVEYASPELQQMWDTPGIGPFIKDESQDRGITEFSTHVARLIARHGKEMAVADIGNNPTYELLYYAGFKMLSGIGLVAGVATQNQSIINGALLGVAHTAATYFQEASLMGLFGNDAHAWEKFIMDAEDGRRLITAEGIRQEAMRRTPGTKFTYIAPRAHTSRVGMYMRDWQNPVVRAKKTLWRHAPGLDTSTRIFKYSPHFASWARVSNTPIT